LTEEKAGPNYEEAERRVGATPEQRLRWLVEFAQEDLASLSRGRALDLDDEILAFTRAGLPGDQGGLALGGNYLNREADFVRQLQQRWRDNLTALLDRGEFSYTATANYILGRTSDGSIEAGISADTEPAFFIAVFRLLAHEGVRVRRCDAKGCGRIFVGPPRQLFCGSRCSQRVRTARFRRQHREAVSDMRHAAYARRQRSKLGLKVKVARRPRRQTT